MAITDPLVLPPDVLLVPVGDLPEEVRRQLTFEEGDYAVTRPRSRTPSRPSTVLRFQVKATRSRQ